jgi:hypothetical protein
MPCADSQSNISFARGEITQKSHSHHDTDACSPWCICNCCGCQGFSYQNAYSYHIISNEELIERTKISDYKSILTSTFSGSIWQPPKLAD